ncbi:MAG: carboxypeptidase regulatory-like domain-containing protein [Gemmatimonadaceae bacterium]|nr:carboxypeptidase regulatory-like domain-containing protein [Gemmatimonadaceae bacterium]
MPVRLVLLVVALAAPAGAQTPDTGARATGTTVSGVVYDSIAVRPLAGATVQLVHADDMAGNVRTDVSDAQGSFIFTDVQDGRYMLGFLHPVLDSLGVEPPVREVVVTGGRPVLADVAIPSPRRLLAAICGEQSVRDSGAVIVGIVRDARSHAPMAGVAVAAEWLEFSVRREGFTRRLQRASATTTETGWFSLCDVPSPGTTTLVASGGADSTAQIEVTISAEPVIRRDFYLGSARTVVAAGVERPAGDTAAPPRTVQAGDGRLSGTVAAINTGAPIAGAQVVMTDGPDARTNERGEWTLADVPLGTRTLEVRALGYYPERRAVNVFTGAPAVHVGLSTLRAVLDTVRVTASRWRDEHRLAFEARRRTGLGRYLTAEQIARRAPVNASDLFRGIAGVATDAGMIRIRRGDSECSPSLYLNGTHIQPMMLGDLTADDIDSWVRPQEIAAIEVYGDVVPPQFQQILLGCGAIAIWTK